jgi:non-heme chloroperoxidase
MSVTASPPTTDEQIERANASGLTPIVFMHRSGCYRAAGTAGPKFFEAAGYTALTPGWPDDPDTVEEANAHPEVFAHKSVGQVADHYAEVIGRLEKKPAIIGHSFGGLLVQMVAGRGLAAATVAIDPGPFRGVLPLATPPITAAPSRSPTSSSATASQTPSAKTKPRSYTRHSPSPHRVRRSSRRRPRTSTPGRRQRSTPRTPTADRF